MENIFVLVKINTAQKMKFSSKDLFSKCGQISRKLQIWSHLLKKSLTENLIFCTGTNECISILDKCIAIFKYRNFAGINKFNSFLPNVSFYNPNVPFLYPLKTSFLRFQGLKMGKNGINQAKQYCIKFARIRVSTDPYSPL